MQTKINIELTAITNARKITSKQVLMWARLEEAQRTYTVERNEPEKQICQTSPCRYCKSSQPPQRCPPYGRRCVECAKMNHISAVCRSSRQAVHKFEEFEDGQINTVNTDIIHYNAKSSGTVAKLKASSFHNSIIFSYKIDPGSNRNMLPFTIFEILFLKSGVVTNQK